MAAPVLSFALNRLANFVHQESIKLGGLQDEVQNIKDELGQMRSFLRIADLIVENYPQLEEWVSQVRDAAYDVEDVLDEFTLHFIPFHLGEGFLRAIKNLKASSEIANKLHIIRERIKNISEAHQRYQSQYGTHDQGSIYVDVQKKRYDRRDDPLLLREAELVGIARPRKELMDMLFTSGSQLHMISIVGMGGLGKTTLVKKVYDDPTVKNRFEHHAWITVSQTFKIEAILKEVIQQLFKELKESLPRELDTMNINSMKQLIHDQLHPSSYVIVFDDVWRVSDWDAIRTAFPRTNCSSRIMMTTRNTMVAQAAMTNISGVIYPLKPLTEKDSRILFCKEAFGTASCPQHLEENAESIIKWCSGLPLAIVVIGGVMATKKPRTEEWELFNRSLSEQLGGDERLKDMTRLLCFSYFELPDHLKICLLYLSILPEDVSIKKNKLIRLWIAEGFVQEKEGMTKEEVAQEYLNDLITRSLVQVLKTSVDGSTKTCVVHGVMRQIILRKARYNNIMTVFTEQGMQCSDRSRRIVIHSCTDNTQVRNYLTKSLRSLVIIRSMGGSMTETILSEMFSNGSRLLKVVELRGAPLEEIPTYIFQLLHLKYLGLRKTKVTSIPKLIGNLQMLETLDLKFTMVKKLANQILKLQRLVHLLLASRDRRDGVEVHRKIGKLQSLQSLAGIDVNQRGIVKLTQLRKLGIHNLRTQDGIKLSSSLEKLTNLRSFYVKNKTQLSDLHFHHSSSTPRFLQRLYLDGRIDKAPTWVGYLGEVTKISLFGSDLKDEPLNLLQDLRNLMELTLSGAYKGKSLCFKAGGFQSLKKLEMAEMGQIHRDEGGEGCYARP